MHRRRCTCCDSEELTSILDLGMHPLADTFVPPERASEGDRLYPLQCDLCSRCGQIQLRAVTDPNERYSGFEYSYTSSNSAVARRHWEEYARDVAAFTRLPKGAFAVEVGSNDGYLSEQIKKLGFDALGVDPSGAMCRLAAERGVETVQGLFTRSLAAELVAKRGRKADLIAANNVLNHANDPRDFAQGVKELLAPGGTFVFEVPYWLRMVQDGKFDMVYHEHPSYFTVSLAHNLFRSVGLHLSHAEEVDYHGGSIRGFVTHAPAGSAEAPPPVAAMMAAEKEHRVLDPAIYGDVRERLLRTRNRFLRKLYALKEQGNSIVCVGAAAKGNTFLNFYRLDATVIDLVTDASPSKIGKFTPGTRIPIAPDAELARYGKVYAIITSWNIADALRRVLAPINPNIEFLNPYEAES